MRVYGEPVMASLARHEGYLLIDHRFSPGTPEVPEGTYVERPTLTCCHCNRIVVLNMARTRPRGYCAKCDHYTCDHVACATECHPIEQSIELALRFESLAQPFLLRGKDGEILFDPSFLDKVRVF